MTFSWNTVLTSMNKQHQENMQENKIKLSRDNNCNDHKISFFNFGWIFLLLRNFLLFTKVEAEVFYCPDSSHFNIHMCHATLWTCSSSSHSHISLDCLWVDGGLQFGKQTLLLLEQDSFTSKLFNNNAETVKQWWDNHLSWKRPLGSLRPSAVVHSIELGGLQVLCGICRAFVHWTTSALDLKTIILSSGLWHSSGNGTAWSQALKVVISYSQEEYHLCHQTLDMSWGLIKCLRHWPFNTTLIHGSPTNTC